MQVCACVVLFFYTRMSGISQERTEYQHGCGLVYYYSDQQHNCECDIAFIQLLNALDIKSNHKLLLVHHI